MEHPKRRIEDERGVEGGRGLLNTEAEDRFDRNKVWESKIILEMSGSPFSYCPLNTRKRRDVASKRSRCSIVMFMETACQPWRGA